MGNQCTGTIPDFSKNTALKFLDIKDNKCTGKIGDFSKNVKLATLYLNENDFTGELPLSLIEQKARGEIRLLKFNWGLTLPDMSNLADDITKIDLPKSGLIGPVPDFSKNTALTIINLSENKLTGSIPDFSKNAALEELELHKNLLEGSIPDFSNNTALKELTLYANALSGTEAWKADTSNYPSLKDEDDYYSDGLTMKILRIRL